MTGFMPASKTLIVTRAAEATEEVIGQLEQYGLAAIASPTTAIRFVAADPDLVGSKGLVFTSANGVRGWIRAGGSAALPAYAVGPATAAAARAVGMSVALTGEDDAASLAGLMRKKGVSGPLLHPTTEIAARFDHPACRRVIVYKAEPCLSLSPAASALLRSRPEATLVLFFSPRSARLFLEQAAREGLTAQLRHAEALAISLATRASAGEGWARVHIAPSPNADAMAESAARLAWRIGGSDDH